MEFFDLVYDLRLRRVKITETETRARTFRLIPFIDMESILEIARKLGLTESDLIPYGTYKAKVRLEILEKFPARGKLVLVSAIAPTPAGEGKTTTTIGLGQAMARLNKSVCLALRESFLGPCLGMRGGATGGGLSQVVPREDIKVLRLMVLLASRTMQYWLHA
jgi:formyltetrahydrofolate synthetase